MTAEEKFRELASAVRALTYYAEIRHSDDIEVRAELKAIRDAMEKVASSEPGDADDS